MAYIEIYRKGLLIEKAYFLNQCLILQKNTGEIVWDTDVSPESKAGAVKVWLFSATNDPQIAFLLPDWKLVLDGQAQEEKFYPEVCDLKGKSVELYYEDYQFRFDIIPGC